MNNRQFKTDKDMFMRWLSINPGIARDEIRTLFSALEQTDRPNSILTNAIRHKMPARELAANIQKALVATPAEQEEEQTTTVADDSPVVVGRVSLRDRINAAFKKKAKPTIKLPKISLKWLIGGGIGLALIVIVVILISALSGKSSPSYTNYDALPTSAGFVIGTDTPTTSTSSDQQFWEDLKTADVPEYSPGNLGWLFNGKTAMGVFLILALVLWAIGEGKVRNADQNKAMLFTVIAIITGLVTVPVLVALTNVHIVGWMVVLLIILAILWAMAASPAWSQNDLSPITVALALTTASLFYIGRLDFITTLGGLFNATWAPWTGVTSLGGVLTLLLTGRGANAVLTILIMVLGLLTVLLAVLETGKKHGHSPVLFIGLLVIVAFLLANWGLNALLQYLITTQHLTLTVTAIFKILVPVLAWVVSLLAAVGIGVAMGDVEVGLTENKQRLGLEKQGTFVQNIADFGILGTVVPLVFGVLIVLF